MRAKSYLLGFICTVGATIILLMFGDQRPEIQNLVSETHRQIKDRVFQNFKDRDLEADEKYLDLLGFGDNARHYPDNVWRNSSLPVIVSYIKQGETEQGVGLARNIAHFLPNHTLLLYNFGLPESDIQLLASHCNSSRCVLHKFDLSLFPSHVSDDKIHAFRPLVIQDALSRAGAVLYLENDQRLITSKISPLVSRAEGKSSVLTWQTMQPVSALTHPRMFHYFKVQLDPFFFLPMVEATRLLVFNTHRVHSNIMLPWVKCALTHECILPIGAQSGGCRFDKKPNYRYSGCHSYDVSALNIVLGVHFKFDPDLYAVKDYDSYFRRVHPTDAALDFALLQDNTTEAGVNF